MLHNQNKAVFLHGIDRSNQFCSVYEYDIANYPSAMDFSDMLRSAVMLSISSLDLLVHSVYKTEVIYRLQNSISINKLSIPFNCLIGDAVQQYNLVDSHVKEIHSFKSFVAPDKISEVLCHFIDNPWLLIAADLDENVETAKAGLKEIVRWRNRIAHEADINPNYGGIELWPISLADTRNCIDRIEKTGIAIVNVIEQSH